MGFFDTDGEDNIYYNVEVINKTDVPKIFKYIDNKGESIINDTSNYEMSILRFALDLDETPLIIFPNNQSDNFTLSGDYTISTVDNTYYSITLDDGAGNINQQFIIYESYGKQSPYIYDFPHFVNLLNKAVRLSAVALGIETDTPYFTYNKSAGCIDFTASNDYNSSVIGHYRIYVNKNLYDVFASAYCGNIVNVSSGRYYEIIVEGRGDNSVSLVNVSANGTLINAGTFAGFRMEPYYPNLAKLVAVESIVFTSSTIPTISEYVNNNNDMVSDTNYSVSKIIKDFQLSTEGVGAIQARGQQHYRSVDNEFISLKSGTNNMRTVDIDCFWKDRYGKLNPLYLPPGTNASMKILFRRK